MIVKSVVNSLILVLVCLIMSKKFIKASNTFARYAKKNSVMIEALKGIFSIFMRESGLIVISAINNFKPKQMFKDIN